jgi:hypothetical protein
VTEFTVLGIGADPRICGYHPVSSTTAEENAHVYISMNPDEPGWFSVLLFDGGLLDLVVEVFFGLLFEL